MSKLFRVLLRLVETLVVLALVAVGVMSTPWFRRALQRRLLAALEETTGGRVEVREFHFHPLILEVVLQGIVLHGSEPAEAPPLFAARTVALRLSPANLLHREVRVTSLDWEGAEIHLRTDLNGSTNVPGPVRRVTPGQVMEQLMELRIGRATLARSTFYWNDRPLRLDFSARDVALLLRFRRGIGYQGSLAASALTAQEPGHGLPPLSFSTHFILAQNELALTSLVWQARGMTGQGSFIFHPVPEPAASFSFQTSAEVAAVNPLLRLPFLQSGNFRLEGQGIYGQGELLLRGRLQTRRLVLRGARFDSGPLEISADYALQRSRLAFSSLKVMGWGGSAQGEAEIHLAGSTPQFRLRALLRQVSLADLLRCSKDQPPLLPELHPVSRVDGPVELSWEGQLEKVNSEFDLHLAAPPETAAGFLPLSGDMKGSVESANGVLVKLEDSTLRTPHSIIRARGTWWESGAGGELPGRLQITVETSQFEEWRPLFEAGMSSTDHLPLSFQSSATLAAEITGTQQKPEIRGSVRLGKFVYRGSTWDSLRQDIVLSADSFEVSNAQLARASSLLTFAGSVQLKDWRMTGASPVRLSGQAQHTPLEGLKSALDLDYPVSGSLSGQVSLAGTISDLNGKGNLRIDAGGIGGEPFDFFSTGIEVSHSTWNFASIEMVKGHGKLTGKAQIDASSRSLTCQLHGAGFSLAEFKRLALALPSLSPSDSLGANPGDQLSPPHSALDGQASVDFQGSGPPQHFHFQSSALVQGLSLAGSPLGDLRLELQGDGPNIQIQGVSSGSAGMFSLSGGATASADWPLELHGQYTAFRLDPWAPLFLHNNLAAQVPATGSFQVRGPLRQPSKLEAEGQVETLEVSFPTLKWRNVGPLEVRYAADRISIQPFRLEGPSTNLTIGASLDLAGSAPLSATIQGMADASFLTLLEPNLQASGQAQISVTISGSPAAPRLNGVVRIENVNLGGPGLPIRFSGLNGEVELEGERATLKSLRGTSGGGTISVEGFVTLALPPRLDLSAKLDQVRVPYPFEFTSILSGSLRLTGTSERTQLRGDLAVNQVLTSANKPWLDQFMQPAGPSQALAPASASSAADRVHLNLRVFSPTPVRLVMQDLRLTANIDVRLQGSLANPVEVGAVHFLDGEAVLRGNRFTLNRGDLNLVNPVRTQASLDLEAETRVQQYTLTVDVSGFVGHLKMTYRSDPPLSTGDVFSLLALGYARQQQQASTTGLVSSFTAGNPLQSVGESAILSQALSTQVGGRIQRIFGVSRIQIDPNVGLPGFNTGARVTVEQQVAHDLTLTYITNTASSQYQIIQFEWAVSESVSLLGVRDPNGIVGVEIKFHRRFR